MCNIFLFMDNCKLLIFGQLIPQILPKLDTKTVASIVDIVTGNGNCKDIFLLDKNEASLCSQTLLKHIETSANPPKCHFRFLAVRIWL